MMWIGLFMSEYDMDAISVEIECDGETVVD